MDNNIVDFAIINFWWCNDHGAILTAYALQNFLEKEGYSSELLKNGRGYKEQIREDGISKLFEEKYLRSSKDIYSTYDDFFEPSNNRKINQKYVGFITGSDQVFRPEYVPDSWFLTFVNGKGKIAASASFGVDEFVCEDNERVERIAKSLQSFDYISVREDTGVDICKEKFNVEATHILDPVFLIGKEEYEKIIKNSTQKKENEFVFCYIRDMNSPVKNMIDNLKNDNGMEIVMCHEKMPIEDFLYFIANCKSVVTDSYHGMCFSIIFNKDYLCVCNKMRGKTRFESLKRQIGLFDANFIEENENKGFIPSIEYSEINKNLKHLSDEGRNWLREALEKTYAKYNHFE